MRIRHIVLESIKPNPRAGRTVFPVAGKREVIEEENGTIVSRRDVTFLRSMHPGPPYLFKYEPMTAECVHCGEESSDEDFDDDWYFDGLDEYPVRDVCPKCKMPDAVEEEIKYETIEEALKRKDK